MIRTLCCLFRVRLALMNGIAAMGGYALLPGSVQWQGLVGTAAGVVLLAAGGSALNQVREIDVDRLMTRTRTRPLPARRMTPATAATVGYGCILTGCAILGAVGGPLPVGIGAAGIVWYLGIYTPLKRCTSLALAIGAVCGAVPPVIGWCIAGGRPDDFRIMLLAGLLYLWQVLHFWLLQRRHEEDFHKAGIPVFGATHGRNDLFFFFRVWLCAFFATAMLLPAFGMMERHSGVALGLFLLPLAVISRRSLEPTLFSYLNFFPLVTTALLLYAR